MIARFMIAVFAVVFVAFNGRVNVDGAFINVAAAGFSAATECENRECRHGQKGVESFHQSVPFLEVACGSSPIVLPGVEG